MDKLCDLHTHSNYSDGTFSPAQLIQAAEEAGLSAVALTDHNTVAGLPDFLAAAESTPVEAVPGIEFSTDYLDKELHIVTLFVQPKHYSAITEITDELNRRKQQSNIDLIARLNQAGYAVSYERIKSAMPVGEPNRALIAAELTRMGYTPSIQDAFRTLLGTKCDLYQPPKHIDAFELIDFVRSLGAVSILAHPYLSLKETDKIAAFLQKAVDCGLQGIETHYSTFSLNETQVLTEIARSFGLAQSGGSDFHGENKPDIRIGVGKGSLRIPIDFLEKIRHRAR